MTGESWLSGWELGSGGKIGKKMVLVGGVGLIIINNKIYESTVIRIASLRSFIKQNPSGKAS